MAGCETPAAPVLVPPRLVLLSYSERELDAFLHTHFSAAPVVGLDIEMKPNFAKGAAPNRVALLQLSTRDAVVLIHLAHVRLPPRAALLLSSSAVLKVGCGILEDARKLQSDLGVRVAGVCETSHVASRMQYPRPGIKGLALAFGFEVSKSKSVTMSNWERRPLSCAQRTYAAQDAHLSLWVTTQLFATSVQRELPNREHHASMDTWLRHHAALPRPAARDAALAAAAADPRQGRLQFGAHAGGGGGGGERKRKRAEAGVADDATREANARRVTVGGAGGRAGHVGDAATPPPAAAAVVACAAAPERGKAFRL